MPIHRPSRQGSRGHTFVEMLVTLGILSILATAVLPLAAMTRRREREIELRRALREVRLALDTYHETCVRSQSGGQVPQGQRGQAQRPGLDMIQIKVEDDPGGTCWPKDLDILIEGSETNVPRHKLKFLRRIPRDPFNREDDEHDGHGWTFRSSTDNPETTMGWNRANVFDVRSASESQALDGSYYKEW